MTERLPETMKYNRLLSISIPVGILMSGCSHNESAITPSSGAFERPTTSQASGGKTGPLHVIFPNYVKPNQGIYSKSTAVIYVELVPLSSTTAYIRYQIKDRFGKTGHWHHKDKKTSENKDSTLFSTTFLYTNSPNDLSLTTLQSGEVQITAVDANSKKSLTWVSSQNYCY